MKRLLSLILLTLFLMAPAYAIDYYVDAVNGVNTPGRDGLTPATAWKTITYAFARTQSNTTADRYFVGAGTYSNDPALPILERETFPLNLRHRMEVIGASAETTIIDAGPGTASARAACAVFQGSATQNFLLEGLTIRGMRTTANGGGLAITGNATGDLRSLRFENNDTTASGGGFYTGGSLTGDVTDCAFTGNSADYYGGGFHISGSLTGSITDCTFTGNSAGNNGGGFCIFGSLTGSITDCTFTGNSANIGGGFHISGTLTGNITDCTFSGNSAGNYGGGFYISASLTGSITDCTFSGNSAGNYGGGFYISASLTGSITDCTFTGNSAGAYGGGIRVGTLPAASWIGRCFFDDNSASQYGSALCLANSSSAGQIENCVFSRGTSDKYQVWVNGTVGLYNNTFAGNLGGGLRTRALHLARGGGTRNVLVNNIFAHHNYAIYEGTAGGGTPTENNLFYDCLVALYRDGQAIGSDLDVWFIDILYPDWSNNIGGLDPLFVNPAALEYDLQYTSPAIDTGQAPGTGRPVPAHDYLGRPRPWGAGYDIGAFEFVETYAIPGEAKRFPDGTTLALSGQLVSRVFSGYFYMQEEDRCSGIRVVWPGGPAEGRRVAVVGTVTTGSNGERQIAASNVSDIGSGELPKPLYMANKGVGGADFAYDPGPPITGQKGVVGAAGLNNIGLLVCTTGTVTSVGADFFYLDDGSGAPVKVQVPLGVTLPAQDSYVCATGISSCFKVGDDLFRLMLVGEQADIVEF